MASFVLPRWSRAVVRRNSDLKCEESGDKMADSDSPSVREKEQRERGREREKDRHRKIDRVAHTDRGRQPDRDREKERGRQKSTV